nr:MAG TPA: hypothetical protein [Caudoviricetes sp.]
MLLPRSGRHPRQGTVHVRQVTNQPTNHSRGRRNTDPLNITKQRKATK